MKHTHRFMMNPNPKNAIFGRMYSRLKPVTNVSENPNLKNLGKMLGAELSWPVLKKKYSTKKLKKFREIESIPKQGCGFPAHLGEPKKTFDVGDWAQSLQTLVILRGLIYDPW